MFQKMYTILFDAVTRSLRDLAEGDAATAKWRLEEAQRETENFFMDWDWEDGAEPEEEPPREKNPDVRECPKYRT